MLCALALGAPSVQAARQSEAEAEHTRLSEEMNKHARKARWHGVERAYVGMLPLTKKGVLLTYRDHYQGAQSARELGNINQVYGRLHAASAQQDTEDVKNWLADINANYGKVELVIPRKWKEKVGLNIDEMPLFPDQRSTIGLAQDRVKQGKSYVGLLPVGDYNFAEKTFTIVPGGDTIRVELGRKQGTEMTRRSSGEKAPFRFTYIGPRADIGLAWTQAADASGGGAQPGDFSGPGARIGGGIELGVGGGWAVIGQVGYQNLFGSPGDADGALEDGDGFTVRLDTMHMAYGWLAGALRIDDLWLAVGPTYAIGAGGVTGVNELCVDKPSSAKCEPVGDVSGEILRQSRMTGTIRAGGAALGASYAMWTVGPLEAALSLNAGAQSDLSRWYPWATMSVTFAPPGPEDGG
jgi:hypothetical protein